MLTIIAFFSIAVQEAKAADDVSVALLSRYAAPEDSLRRRAAEFLLEGLPLQWHYDVTRLEETGAKVKVMDSEVVDGLYVKDAAMAHRIVGI